MKRIISTIDPILHPDCQYHYELTYPRKRGDLRGLNQNSKHVREFPRKFLASKANQVGTGDHSDIGYAELEDMPPLASIV